MVGVIGMPETRKGCQCKSLFNFSFSNSLFLPFQLEKEQDHQNERNLQRAPWYKHIKET